MITFPWQRARALRAHGVLGMNQRNGDFIARVNPRRLYPLVDDKVRTKTLAQAAGIQVPQLYGLIAIQHQVLELPKLLEGREDFVVKPVNGSGGNGVLVIVGRRKGRYRKASGAQLTRGRTRTPRLEHPVGPVQPGRAAGRGDDRIPRQGRPGVRADFLPGRAGPAHGGLQGLSGAGHGAPADARFRTARPTCTRAPSAPASTSPAA